MLLIVSPEWSKGIKDWWKDPSGYGVVSSVTIQAMSQEITIIGTYWPFLRQGADNSAATGSLWRQLQDNYLTPYCSFNSAFDNLLVNSIFLYSINNWNTFTTLAIETIKKRYK